MSDNLITILKQLIIEAGNLALEAKRLGIIVDYKLDKSPVTNADRAVSDLIYNKLMQVAPEVTVICEERAKPKNFGTVFWLIDPIDGTQSYIKGEDNYTVNIALIEHGVPVLGLIYQPTTNMLYYTDKNSKLHIERDGEPVKIQEPNRLLNDSIAVVGNTRLDARTSDFLKKHMVHKILPISSSIKLCLIASGTADIYPKFEQTMEWDIAAGHALVKASGGEVLDMNGNPLAYGRDNFLNPHFVAYGKHWLNNYMIE